MKDYLSESLRKYLAKHKYYCKVLSEDAMFNTYLRVIDVEPIIQRNIWLNIYPFDLSQLGIGLVFGIVGIEFSPLSLGFLYYLPNIRELLQGILIKFDMIDWSKLFPELADFDLFIRLNFLKDHMPKTLKKAYYDISKYDLCYYDPTLFRELITKTIWKLRQMNPSNPLYEQTVKGLADLLGISTACLDFINDKVNMIFSAQKQTFIFGLGVLGFSTLKEKKDGFVEFDFIDGKGRTHKVKIRHLSDLLYGFILGVTPLGYGILLPDVDIHQPAVEKGEPRFMLFLKNKNDTIFNTSRLLAFSFSNYQRYDEVVDVHGNERVMQYDSLMWIRNIIEHFVHEVVSQEVGSQTLVRQYQNAVLQYIGWITKRHTWGMELFKLMPEDDYKEFWVKYWTTQGLNETILNRLYTGMQIWKRAILREKSNISMLIQMQRKALAQL